MTLLDLRENRLLTVMRIPLKLQWPMKLGLFKMYLSFNDRESFEPANIFTGVIEWFSFAVSYCL